MAKCWCFTLNNWTEEERKTIWEVDCQYIVIGKEVGKEGTPHLQGFINFNKYTKLAQCKLLLGKRAHLECARKSSVANRNYCIKEGDYAERGELNCQGRRTDIIRLKEAMDAGESEWDMWQELPNEMGMFPKMYAAYKAAMQREEAVVLAETELLPEVHVLWGDTGVGKTTSILREYGPRNCYSAEWGDSTHIWWDGYESQENIIINDFYGNLPLCYMLRLLGDHCMRLNAKNTFRYRRAKRIFITSNVKPEVWYNPATVPEKKLAALMRRLTSVEELGMHARPQCFQ